MESPKPSSPPSRHARTHWLVWIGSIGPLGFLPASGTATVAIAGIPLFYLAGSWSIGPRIAATLAFTALAVVIHHFGDRILGEKDSRKLVWDELAGYFVAVALLPFAWPVAITAFVIERVLDITKAPPAGWIERTWPGGFGVVGDDVVAGVYTCVILHAVLRWAPAWLGL